MSQQTKMHLNHVLNVKKNYIIFHHHKKLFIKKIKLQIFKKTGEKNDQYYRIFKIKRIFNFKNKKICKLNHLSENLYTLSVFVQF